jgi:polyhydroxybutyrate depolymerase
MLPVLAFLLACGADKGTDTSPTAPDLRFDHTTWPDNVIVGDRQSLVIFPTEYDGSTLLPVIMELHGYSATGLFQDMVYQASLRVDEQNFILVLPDGTPNSSGLQFWNATESCCDGENSGVNDVKYLKGVLDEVELAFPVDPERISIMGHSNGGYMSYRMACEIPERISGIAPLAGLAWADPADCKNPAAVNVLHIHGTADDSVPFEPGFLPGAWGSLERFTERAGCTGTTEDLGNADYENDTEGLETERYRYTDGCSEGFVGEMWQMNDVGHLPAFAEAFRDDLVSWLLDKRRPQP